MIRRPISLLVLCTCVFGHELSAQTPRGRFGSRAMARRVRGGAVDIAVDVRVDVNDDGASPEDETLPVARAAFIGVGGVLNPALPLLPTLSLSRTVS